MAPDTTTTTGGEDYPTFTSMRPSDLSADTVNKTYDDDVSPSPSPAVSASSPPLPPIPNLLLLPASTTTNAASAT